MKIKLNVNPISRLVSAVCMPLAGFTLALVVGGCGDAEQEKTTAERLKNAYKDLDKEQATEAAITRRPADFMETIKTELDRPRNTGNDAQANQTIAETKAKSSGLDQATLAPTAASQTPPPVTPQVRSTAGAPELNTPPNTSPAATLPTAASTAAFTEPSKLKQEQSVTTAPVAITPTASNATTAAVVARPPDLNNADRNARPVARREPEFPIEAKQRGVETGVVRARATVNSAGEVIKVEIIAANPPRIFDKSVIAALRRWTFNPGGNDRVYDGEFSFRQ